MSNLLVKWNFKNEELFKGEEETPIPIFNLETHQNPKDEPGEPEGVSELVCFSFKYDYI